MITSENKSFEYTVIYFLLLGKYAKISMCCFSSLRWAISALLDGC
jgi:hypothetical protein